MKINNFGIYKLDEKMAALMPCRPQDIALFLDREKGLDSLLGENTFPQPMALWYLLEASRRCGMWVAMDWLVVADKVTGHPYPKTIKSLVHSGLEQAVGVGLVGTCNPVNWWHRIFSKSSGHAFFPTPTLISRIFDFLKQPHDSPVA